MTGALIVSIDVEMYWGTCDQRTVDEYGDNVLGGARAIPQMLRLFERHAVTATWAVAGLPCLNSLLELREGLPEPRPAYANPAVSTYEFAMNRASEVLDRYLFIPAIAEQIARATNQEWACHSFSHLYATEPGVSLDDFARDLLAFRMVEKKFGVRARSFVFPRNKYRTDHLELLAQHGFESFRGNERHWAYKGDHPVSRAFRLADAAWNLSGSHCSRWSDICEPISGLIDLPASRFLRPLTGRAAFDRLHLGRVLAGLREAAQRGSIFHLWWHPENFGVNTEANLSRLERILTEFVEHRRVHGMRSLGMAEAARQARERAEA